MKANRGLLAGALDASRATSPRGRRSALESQIRKPVIMLPGLKQLVAEVAPLHSKLVLLIGPPGCGKTALLSGIADQAGASVMNLGLELSMRLAKLPHKQRRRRDDGRFRRGLPGSRRPARRRRAPRLPALPQGPRAGVGSLLPARDRRGLQTPAFPIRRRRPGGGIRQHPLRARRRQPAARQGPLHSGPPRPSGHWKI